MKAWQVTGVGSPESVIKIQQRELPVPGHNEVQIKVAAAGVGLPDVLMCKGEYAFSPELPFTPGQEVAGVITAVGEGCSAQIGQRVMAVTSFYTGNGSFAEYCLAPEHALYPIADEMSDVEAAVFCIPYHTAYVGLTLRAQMQPGEVLLVHGGAGGTGSAGIQLGKAMGAVVVATAGTDEKLAYCQSLGADHVVNYREPGFAAKVLACNNGNAVDVVYDPVGGDIFEKSLECTASGGRLLAVGFASGSWGSVATHDLVMSNCSVMGVFVGAYTHEQLLPGHQALMEHYKAGDIKVQVDEVADFESVGDCLDRLEKRQVSGKIAISLS